MNHQGSCLGSPLRKAPASLLTKAGGEPVPAVALAPGETDDESNESADGAGDEPGSGEPSLNGE